MSVKKLTTESNVIRTVPEGGAHQVRQHLQVQAQLPKGREGESRVEGD